MNHEKLWLKNIASAGNSPGGPQMPRFSTPLGSMQRLYVAGRSASAGEHALRPYADSAPPRYMPVPAQLKPSTSSLKLFSAPSGIAGTLPVQAGPSRFVPAEILLPVEKIEWIEAAEYYSCLHSNGRRFMLRETITNLSNRLDPTQFVRIHRSLIVNLNQIREIYREGQTEGSVVLVDGRKLRMSKAGHQKLVEIGKS